MISLFPNWCWCDTGGVWLRVHSFSGTGRPVTKRLAWTKSNWKSNVSIILIWVKFEWGLTKFLYKTSLIDKWLICLWRGTAQDGWRDDEKSWNSDLQSSALVPIGTSIKNNAQEEVSFVKGQLLTNNFNFLALERKTSWEEPDFDRSITHLSWPALDLSALVSAWILWYYYHQESDLFEVFKSFDFILW